MRQSSLLVTGGASFIGSEFTRQAVKRGWKVIVIDKLTYAGDLKRLKEAQGGFRFYKQDICEKKAITGIFKKEKPAFVAHFAAESHVDRSILGSEEFIRTNILGTGVLLDAARNTGVKKFIHISTDEVYGDIDKGQFYETTSLNASSPYSASKAGADLLVKSYVRTHNFPAMIARPSNNYGPWQYPEKFIPVVILKAMNNERVPVYARGLNVREWLHVSDCAAAIFIILRKGRTGEVYNVGSGNERKNIDVAKRILDILKKPRSLIEFVRDRPGHDFRYSLNFDKIRKELGWQPKVSFEEGLAGTVEWYRSNFGWTRKKVAELKRYWKKIYK